MACENSRSDSNLALLPALSFMPEAELSEPAILLVLQFSKYSMIYRRSLARLFILFKTFRYKIC